MKKNRGKFKTKCIFPKNSSKEEKEKAFLSAYNLLFNSKK
jgi:hypothetical protein